MGGLPRVQRIEPLGTLTEAQRELLAEATTRDVAELVVYRFDDGVALVAPRNDSVDVGAEVVCVGSVKSLQRVAVSGGRVVEEVDLQVAEEIRRSWFPQRR